MAGGIEVDGVLSDQFLSRTRSPHRAGQRPGLRQQVKDRLRLKPDSPGRARIGSYIGLMIPRVLLRPSPATWLTLAVIAAWTAEIRRSRHGAGTTPSTADRLPTAGLAQRTSKPVGRPHVFTQMNHPISGLTPNDFRSDCYLLKRQKASGKRGPGLKPSEAIAALAVSGTVIAGLFYTYQRSFYLRFQMTPEEAGLTYASLVARASVGTIMLGSVVGVVYAFVPMSRMLAEEQPSVGFIARQGLKGLLLAAWAWLVYAGLLTDRAGKALAVIVVSATVLMGVIALGMRAIVKKKAQPTPQAAVAGPSQRPILLRPFRRYRAVTLAAVAVPLATAGMWKAGLGDSARLIRAHENATQVSVWQFVAGVSTPISQVSWSGPPPDPFQNNTPVVRILGQVNDEVVMYNLNSCYIVRAYVGSVVVYQQSGRSESEPGGSGGVLNIVGCKP
jgi:hypothetical protein